MNRIIISLLLLVSVNSSLYSQIVNFSDQELKRFLINENCVDTTGNGVSFSNDLSVDLNGDNEIQLSEALNVNILEIEDFADSYAIRSLLDLNSFSNLKYLKLIFLDSIERVANLNLDSLTSLWISEIGGLKIIDISNLPGLTSSLRIEGIGNLDTLNIRNGNVANQFSLFYTQNTKFACVDSLAKEYDAFYIFGAMLPGVLPSLLCEQIDLTETSGYNNTIEIYPNPTSGFITIKSQEGITGITIMNTLGQIVSQPTSFDIIDVSLLKSGVYFLNVRYSNSIQTKRVVLR